MQYYRGDIFAGAVVENRKGEEMILVDILPRGYVETLRSFLQILLITILVNVLKLNIDGCLFRTLPISICKGHRQTRFRYQSPLKQRNRSIRANGKLTICPELMIPSLRVAHGQSSKPKLSLAILRKLKSTSPKKIRFGSILARLLRRQRHSLQRI